MRTSYRDLIAWQKAMDLVTAVYRVTADFPRDEVFGITSQMRRSAVSVPSNIAEGDGRLSDNEFKHFLGLARGSLLELQTQLQIAVNLGYLTGRNAEDLISSANEVGRILNGLIYTVQKDLKANG